jgi:hypothetical protein
MWKAKEAESAAVDASNPGGYSHNPRWFYNFAAGQWINL